MNRNTNWKAVAGAALGTGLLNGAAWAAQSGSAGAMAQSCQKVMGGAMSRMGGMSCCAPKTGAEQPAQAEQEAQVQRATVVINDGYTPNKVNVQAGKPLELMFESKGDSCANTVSIPALKQTFTLQSGGKKTLTFTPKKGQTIAFACGMGMYRGQIVAR